MAATSGVVDELLELATKGDNEQVAIAVDTGFGRLKPEDIASLQVRLSSAQEELKPAIALVVGCIQKSMDKRMEGAKAEIDALLISSGDIDQNIRECLARQDSPVPIMSLLQMNIARAQQSEKEQQFRALTYVFKVMEAELEKVAPPADVLIRKCLGIGDKAERQQLLRVSLSSDAGSTAVQPEALSAALVKLVEDAEGSISADDAAQPSVVETLKSIRSVALDAALIVKQVFGKKASGEFTDDLQPLFQALSRASPSAI